MDNEIEHSFIERGNELCHALKITVLYCRNVVFAEQDFLLFINIKNSVLLLLVIVATTYQEPHFALQIISPLSKSGIRNRLESVVSCRIIKNTRYIS